MRILCDNLKKLESTLSEESESRSKMGNCLIR
jgi:hypothetical protein